MERVGELFTYRRIQVLQNSEPQKTQKHLKCLQHKVIKVARNWGVPQWQCQNFQSTWTSSLCLSRYSKCQVGPFNEDIILKKPYQNEAGIGDHEGGKGGGWGGEGGGERGGGLMLPNCSLPWPPHWPSASAGWSRHKDENLNTSHTGEYVHSDCQVAVKEFKLTEWHLIGVQRREKKMTAWN